jgi:enoyl-CoA hydratase/carnithine racemase
MSDRVALHVDDEGIARLTLTRPDAHNAIDPAMVEALAGAVERAGAEPDLKAMLITAEGRSFSVGGDLDYLGARAERLPEELDRLIGRYHETLTRLAELPVPVVCAAKGAVAGGAFGLLWCADVTIVAQDTKITSGFVQLGLSGDGGITWWLPRLVGLQRARQLLLSSEPITGAVAADWGLVTVALPAHEVGRDADRAVRALAGSPTAAYAEIRLLLAKAFECDLRHGLAAEHEAMLRTAATDEARELVRRFAEGRARRDI